MFHISATNLDWLAALLFLSVDFDDYSIERKFAPVFLIEADDVDININILFEEVTYEKVYAQSIQAGDYTSSPLRPSRPRCRGPPTKSKPHPQVWFLFCLKSKFALLYNSFTNT